MTLPPSIDSLFSLEAKRKLVDLRREIHRDPELAFQEQRTAKRLEAALGALRPTDISRVAGTGVIARFAGRDGGTPAVALRGDIDALPIQENTGLDYASRNAGVMHACGHDVHATWVVGAAHLLSERPAAGDVLIVLQPAEETGQGAQAVMQSGVLDGVSAIFGAHVDRRFPVGAVVAEAGPLAASADNFAIELVGSGAHAARPHEAADPIVGAGALIAALQTIVSRRLDPSRPAVVTIGTVNAGSAPNVIPDRAMLTGTLRATDPDTRSLLHEEVARLAEAVAVAHRLRAKVAFEQGPPPIVNPTEAANWARSAAISLLGADSVVPLGFVNLAAEDFAYYMERIPGCFVRVGAREPGSDAIPAHTPRFYAADESIFVGAAVLAETARVASVALGG
jgi:hippurate hydrolase